MEQPLLTQQNWIWFRAPPARKGTGGLLARIGTQQAARQSGRSYSRDIAVDRSADAPLAASGKHFCAAHHESADYHENLMLEPDAILSCNPSRWHLSSARVQKTGGFDGNCYSIAVASCAGLGTLAADRRPFRRQRSHRLDGDLSAPAISRDLRKRNPSQARNATAPPSTDDRIRKPECRSDGTSAAEPVDD